MFSMDQLIAEFDRALRAVAGVAKSSRPSPGEGVTESELNAEERAQAAALMRVNHVGEMCADEAKHRDTAIQLGAAELPSAVKLAMRFASKVMTTVAYRI